MDIVFCSVLRIVAGNKAVGCAIEVALEFVEMREECTV